jgi:hypothetical protein
MTSPSRSVSQEASPSPSNSRSPILMRSLASPIVRRPPPAENRTNSRYQGISGIAKANRIQPGHPHTGQSQGELVRHPPGSNGGVHRGPRLSGGLGVRERRVGDVQREDGAKNGRNRLSCCGNLMVNDPN